MFHSAVCWTGYDKENSIELERYFYDNDYVSDNDNDYDND